MYFDGRNIVALSEVEICPSSHARPSRIDRISAPFAVDTVRHNITACGNVVTARAVDPSVIRKITVHGQSFVHIHQRTERHFFSESDIFRLDFLRNVFPAMLAHFRQSGCASQRSDAEQHRQTRRSE